MRSEARSWKGTFAGNWRQLLVLPYTMSPLSTTLLLLTAAVNPVAVYNAMITSFFATRFARCSGKYNDGVGLSTDCYDCQKGKYAPTTGYESCRDCITGTYASELGSDNVPNAKRASTRRAQDQKLALIVPPAHSPTSGVLSSTRSALVASTAVKEPCSASTAAQVPTVILALLLVIHANTHKDSLAKAKGTMRANTAASESTPAFRPTSAYPAPRESILLVGSTYV